MTIQQDSEMAVIATRAYKNVLGEIYYCVVSIYPNTKIPGFIVHTDWKPDDGFTKNVQYLKSAKITPHLPRLFVNGSENTPIILPFDIKNGCAYAFENGQVIPLIIKQ